MGGKYRIAGIDVHKAMLAVVIGEEVDAELVFVRRQFGTGAQQLRALREWLTAEDVQEAVMESTAQYWKPVWQELEGKVKLHLAQAHSNRAPKGRKRDFADAERLVKRHAAGELILSFVPDAEQRLWRTMTRTKQQLTRDRVRLQNQLEALLEDVHIKLATQVSDLLGLSSRRILEALAAGEAEPERLAALADRALRATPENLCDALAAARTLGDVPRQLLKLFLERLALLESQIAKLDQTISVSLQEHRAAVVRLAEVPGLGVDSAQQIVAEVGPVAATFDSAAQLASWVGVCPGREESAGVSRSDSSPKGNRQMRRILNQAANAAVKAKGTVFESLYRRLVPRLGHFKAIWAVAHRICRMVWKILHEQLEYEEYGQRPNPVAVRKRANRLIRELRNLGYLLEVSAPKEEVFA